MNGYADLEGFLALNFHGPDAPRDHGLGNVVAANTADFHFVAAANPQLVGQFDRNLNKRLRHQLYVHGIVLGPVVIMLGQPVSGADDVVFLPRGCVLVHIRLISLHDRIVGLVGMQRVRDRALDWFVVFGERTVRHRAQGHKYASHALRIHNERSHVILGR